MGYWNERVSGAIAGTNDYKALIALQPIAPLWDLSDRSFFEVLIRLKNPSGEILPAGAFIDAIDNDEGLMLLLDEWVLKQSVEIIRSTGNTLSFNLSAWSIRSPLYQMSIANTLSNANVRPSKLCIELSEKDAIGHAEQLALEKMGQNHDFYLDDFGALENQCSSFGYTLYGWVSGVKIDMEFTKRIGHSGKNGVNARVGIKTLLDLCARTARNCIVEGVESIEQLDYLRQISPLGAAVFVQGWAIGHPEVV